MVEILKKYYKKIIKYGLLVAIFVSVLIVAVEEIRAVLQTDIQTYHVNEQYESTMLTQEKFEKEFLCVGSLMETLQVEAVLDENISGKVCYQIKKADGTIVVEETVEATALITEAMDGFYIPVAEIGLEQGARYILSVDFKEAEYVSLVLENGNLSIRQYFHFPYKTQYIIGIIGFVVLAILWLYMVVKRGLTYKMFLLTSLLLGIILVLGKAPMSRDDEYRHFIRSYTGAVDDVSIEIMDADGTESGLIGMYGGVDEYIAIVPYEINELRLMDFEENYNGYGYVQEVNTRICVEKLIATIKAESTETIYKVSASATGGRSDLFYWPQMLAMNIAELLGANGLEMYYVACFGQMLICVFMETLAIYIAPRIKEMVWLLAFIPNAWFLKTSCNPDGLLISEIILLAGIVVWLKEEKIDLISPKGILGLIGYALLCYNILVMKVPYIIACVGLLLYLTKDNLATLWKTLKKNKYITIGVSVLVIIGIGAIIGIMGNGFWLSKLYMFLPEEHFTYILGHPAYILRLFSMKWIEMVAHLYVSMKGSNLFPYPIMIVVLLMCMKKRQPVWKRFAFAVTFAVLIMVIVLVGYTLTPADYGQIWGITYRYILPFVIVGALCLPAGNEKTESIAQKLVPLAVFVTTATTMLDYVVWWSI